MASTNPCFDAARAAAGTDATDKQLEEIMKLLEARAKRATRDDPGLSQGAAYQKAAADLAAEERLKLLIAKRQRAINVLAKKRRLGHYAEMAGSGASRVDALRSLNVGVEGPFKGAGKSVDAVQHALEDTVLTGPMVQELESAGLLRVALLENPEFETMVAKEMARANGDAATAATGNLQAVKMAEIFNKYVGIGRVLQNAAGAFIRKLPGYIVRQGHDQARIHKAKGVWQKDMLEWLDERTFDGVDDPKAWLDAAWANLASGNHEKASGGSSWLGGFEGPGNLAKRASAERELHFKSPEAWIAYNNKYGRQSLWEAVLSANRYAAKNTAIMRTWGTNPEAAFKADLRQLQAEAKAAMDIKDVEGLGGWLTKGGFDQISGAVDVHGNPSVAQINAGVRGIVNWSALGQVVFAALGDVALRASTLRWNGIPLSKVWANSVGNLLTLFRTSGEKRQVARMLNIGTQGILGGVMNRIHATDNIPGVIGKMSNAYFKVTLLTGWTDGWSRATGLILANEMGDHIAAARAFADLSELHQTTLRRYGIGELEWDALQQTAVHKADGDNFLMPEHVRELPDEAITNYLNDPEASPRRIREAREDLATSLATYYTDQVREALTFAGAKEKAMLTLGTEKGTPRGEAIGYFTQFKQFPLTAMSKHLNREMHRGGRLDKVGLAHLLATTTALGTVSVIAKGYLRGEDMRELESPGDSAELLIAGMMQGGGLGLYGDFIFGSTERMGRSFMESLAPPVAGKMQPFVDVLTAARNGDDPTAKVLKGSVGLLPYNNLFGLRLAVDHLFLRGLQEQVSPGYLRRYQRQVERERNVDFWLEPTSALNQ